MQTLDQMGRKDVRIVLLVGGSGKAGRMHPMILGADIILHFDATKELEVKSDIDGDALILSVPLAPGSDSKQLVKYFRAMVDWEDICARVNVSLTKTETGLMQMAAVGTMAYLQTRMTKVYPKVIERCRQVTNGGPKHIEVFSVGGLSGGTGGGVTVLAINDLVAELQLRFKQTVVVKHIVSGPVTFDNMSEMYKVNTRANHALRFVDMVGHTIEEKEDEIRHIVAYELPMAADDGDLRKEFQSLIIQALMSRSVSEVSLDAPGNNMTSNLNAMGKMVFGQVGVTKLGGAVNPVASFASHAINEVGMLLKLEVVDQLPTVSVQSSYVEGRKARHTEFVELMSAAGSGRPADALSAYVLGQIEPKCDITFATADSPNSTLSLALLVEPPAGADTFRKRHAELLAVKRALSVKKSEHEALVREAVENFEDAVKRFDNILKRLAPRNAIEWGLNGSFKNRDQALDELEAILEEISRAQPDKEVKEFALKEVNRAIESVNKAIETLQGYLVKIREWLIEESKVGVKVENFTFNSVQELLQGLITARMAEDRNRFRALLARGVAGLTAEGLALLLRLDTTEPSALVKRLLEKPDVVGPEWAGYHPSIKLTNMIVLPKTEPMLFEQLRSMLPTMSNGTNVKLCMTDTLTGGIAVVRLEMSMAADLEEVLGQSLSDYHDTMRSKQQWARVSRPRIKTLEDVERLLNVQSELGD